MITAVISGKGGAGKTTVSLTLARCKEVLLVDADLGAPNLHLFLGRGKEVSTLSLRRPVLGGKCRRCWACLKTCPFGALLPDFSTTEDCLGCGVCALACPFGVLRMEERPVGKVFFSSGKPSLLWAEVEPQAELGPLVGQLLRKAKELPFSEILVDSPAGLHCPVLRILAEADRVIVVAEPTPAGFSDFLRVLEVLEIVEKPGSLVINKATGGPWEKRILEEAERRGLDFWFRLGYSPHLAERMARGEMP